MSQAILSHVTKAQLRKALVDRWNDDLRRPCRIAARRWFSSTRPCHGLEKRMTRLMSTCAPLTSAVVATTTAILANINHSNTIININTNTNIRSNHNANNNTKRQAHTNDYTLRVNCRAQQQHCRRHSGLRLDAVHTYNASTLESQEQNKNTYWTNALQKINFKLIIY